MIEGAVLAGMSLGRFDGRRSAVVLTVESMRGKVKAADLRVPSTRIAKTFGADGAALVAWAQRGRVVGVVWHKGNKVRYSEASPSDLLPPSVIAAMHKAGWDS